MSDAVLPLGGVAFDGLVSVEETGPVGMITVRGDFASDTVQNAICDLTGTAFPAQRKACTNGAKSALWMSPDELLVLVPYAEAQDAVAQLRDALAGEHHLVENVSDARAVFTLTGAELRDVIGKLAPVDMSVEAFQPGDLRRTRFAQVAAAFWMSDAETAQIICFRSVAEYMFNLLCTAADPAAQVGHY